MVSFKRFSLLLFGLLLTVFIAACSGPFSSNTTTGSNTTASKTTSNNTSATGYGNTSKTAAPTMAAQNNKMTTPTTTMGGNTMTTPTTAMGGNSNAFIHTTQVKLNGATITVLTNAKGMVLYYRLSDPKPMSGCTGACATAWPPVLATSMNMMTVSSSMQLPHKLTIFKTANGQQVEYDGHPLYTYAGDMTAGQFTGRGMGMVWYLVSTGL